MVWGPQKTNQFCCRSTDLKLCPRIQVPKHNTYFIGINILLKFSYLTSFLVIFDRYFDKTLWKFPQHPQHTHTAYITQVFLGRKTIWSLHPRSTMVFNSTNTVNITPNCPLIAHTTFDIKQHIYHHRVTHPHTQPHTNTQLLKRTPTTTHTSTHKHKPRQRHTQHTHKYIAIYTHRHTTHKHTHSHRISVCMRSIRKFKPHLKYRSREYTCHFQCVNTHTHTTHTNTHPHSTHTHPHSTHTVLK